MSILALVMGLGVDPARARYWLPPPDVLPQMITQLDPVVVGMGCMGAEGNECELYGRRERKYISSYRLTLLAETALAAALLREQMQPKLPIALVTEPSIGAFLGREAGVALPWDLYSEAPAPCVHRHESTG